MPEGWDRVLEAAGGEVDRLSEASHARGGPVAVVLFQLGGPDSLQAVEPFLYNLFSDPDIIDFPFSRLARPALARLMASTRAKKVAAHYARIGGKSPIGELTELQARALERELRKTLDARVFVAMRYWHPLTEKAVRRIEEQPFREIVLLPLYPQYSKTTTGSSLNEWKRRYAPKAKDSVPVRIIREFFDHPLYVEAVVEKINQGLHKFACRPEASGAKPPQGNILREPDTARLKPCPEAGDKVAAATPDAAALPGDVHLVFSAHGLPMSVIEAGDPYEEQVNSTVRLVLERGGWANPHRVCYQSRVGAGRWLGPSLEEALMRLARDGAEKVLVVPISFVSDHVETLNEIDIEARALAEESGMRRFELMPALNDSPKFIQALADLVLAQVGAGRMPALR